MGIHLTSLVKPGVVEVLVDKTIAVDALNWLYQFLSIIRQRDGTPLMDGQGAVTSHLSGIFYRSLKLMEEGVRLVYVFDGPPPAMKRATAELRHERRAEAAKKWTAALEEGDEQGAKKYAMQATSVNTAMIEEAKKLISAMGMPCVEAPSEGEALCSLMTQKKEAYAAATQDYDAFLFGCPRIIRNLAASKKGVIPEMLVLDETLKDLAITREQLILLGMLVGTDFNPGGVKGIGPKKALDLVKKHKTLDELLPNIDWAFDTKPKEIFDFFMSPPYCDYTIKFGFPDERKIKEILCEQHDFSDERVSSALAKYSEAKQQNQKSLSKWF
ncbi:MAG: flap endonuclease-1 [Candidatus Aenigmarchaeota archaeon]|nr:flap endonuclease-1 [Candidatus Aenigmarchaeota archaeon]